MSAQPIEEELIPALYAHCCDAYGLMEARATRVGTQVIWEGFLTRLITEDLHLSVPYYTTVRNALLRMGCIIQTKRGGGSAPSQYILVHQPSMAAYRDKNPLKKPGTKRVDSLEQQVRSQNERIAKLETTVRLHSQVLGTPT